MNVFDSDSFPTSSADSLPRGTGATRGVWGPKLIGALRSAGTNAHNFKVRIQATRALREMRTLELFERRHAAVWWQMHVHSLRRL